MSSRRTFLKQAGIFSAAFGVPGFSLITNDSKFKLGLQLYSIRDAMESDVKGTLKKVSGFGYQEVETYGFNYGSNKYYWNLHPKDAGELLDNCQLTTSSGHYDLDKFFAKTQVSELKKYVEECIEGAKILGQSYIVWPWLAPEFRTIDEFKRLAATLNDIGEMMNKEGLQLVYHNHDFEFIDHNGQIGYDIIINETDPRLVLLEMDLYWVSYASALTPLDWFKKQPGRFVIWHLKDMDKKDRTLHTTMGDGQIDFRTILNNESLAGVKHMFVEQGNNYIPDSMSCVQRSASYVKNVLFKR